MKPAPFLYFCASSLEKAVSLLQEGGDEAKLIAGGQSLVPTMNMRLARPGILIDLNRIPGLSEIRMDGDQVRIGALVRHHDLETSEVLKQHSPLLAEAAAHVGYPAIRNRGTIAGSLAHNDPAATLPVAIACLDATILTASPRGQRQIPVGEFLVGLYTTALETDEIITEILIPAAGPGVGTAFTELARRKQGDFPVVSVAVQIKMSGDKVEKAAITLGSAGPGPLRATAAEEALTGQVPGAKLIEWAAQLASAGIDPSPDIHASTEYRRAMVPVITGRALTQAVQRAKGGIR